MYPSGSATYAYATPRRMLAALDQPAACRFDLRNRPVEVDALITQETKTLNRGGPTDFVKRDHVFRSR